MAEDRPAQREAFGFALEQVLGPWIRESSINAQQMWGALANIIWTHRDGEIVHHSFRDAAALVAAIRRTGDYRDWYCQGLRGIVTDNIAAAMNVIGWSAAPYPEVPNEGSLDSPEGLRVYLSDAEGNQVAARVRKVVRRPK